MPTRCKKGFNRYPPKTGNCTLKSQIPKRSKKSKSPRVKKPRCKKGTRRHPPKTGSCVETRLIGKKNRVPTPILPSFSNLSNLTDSKKSLKSSNRSSDFQPLDERLIYKWEIDNDLGGGEMTDEDRQIVKDIVKNNKNLTEEELYDLINEKLHSSNSFF
jgi:hypothetical protein